MTTFGPGGNNHAGTVIAMVDANGTVTVVSCSPDSTITVMPLRGSPEPSTIFNGGREDALSSIATQLQNDGAI